MATELPSESGPEGRAASVAAGDEQAAQRAERLAALAARRANAVHGSAEHQSPAGKRAPGRSPRRRALASKALVAALSGTGVLGLTATMAVAAREAQSQPAPKIIQVVVPTTPSLPLSPSAAPAPSSTNSIPPAPAAVSQSQAPAPVTVSGGS